jgi:hypothetical protein
MTMDHLNLDLALTHQAMRRDEAAAARLAGAVRSSRRGRRLPFALTPVRRSGRRAPAVA